jgi:uncharacterized membrane protein YqjE
MAQTRTPRPPASELSVGELVAQASKDVSLLIRGELNLAKVELRDDVRRIILAVVLLGMSAFVGCLMLVLILFGFVYGLMTLGIWPWASFLIVAGICLVLIALAMLIAVLRVRGVTGLRETRATVQETIQMLRGTTDKRPEIAGPAQR